MRIRLRGVVLGLLAAMTGVLAVAVPAAADNNPPPACVNGYNWDNQPCQ